METFWQDLRYAARTLAAKRGFTLVVVLTLALGIGANTAIFSVVNAVLMRPLPFRDGDRIVRIYSIRDNSPPYISLRPRTFLAIQEQGKFFESAVAQRFTNWTLRTPEGPERIVGIAVSEDWLRTLGVAPVLGRGFTPKEAAGGRASGVVVISHGFWERRLGADPQVLGQTVTMNDEPYTIVGVMPSGFRYPYESEVWTPMDLRANANAVWGLNAQARLKPGITVEEANAELAVLGPQLAQELPAELQGMGLTVRPTRQVLLGDNSNLVLALAAAVGFVLLIACANVGNLLLARSVARQKELAIRTTLGASRSRQVRQLMTESLLLGLLGGIAGLAIAAWSTEFLTVLIPSRMTQVLGEIPIDGRVLGFTLLASVLTGILFGLAPALRASRPNLQELMKEGGRSSGGAASHRLLSTLVVSEVALAMVLLTGAGLMIRNFERLQALELGYATDVATLTVPLESSPSYDEASARIQFVRQVEQELEALPGVSGAGVTCIFPSSRGNFLAAIEIDGRPVDPNQSLIVNHRLVSAGFLPTLGVPLLQGRHFTEADRDGAQPVAIISEALAKKYFPGEDPIGKRLRSRRSDADTPWLNVVGVVGDVKEFYDVAETWYLPYAQNADGRFANQLVFAVRSAVPGVADGLRRAVWAVDPALPVFGTATVEEMYAESLTEQKFGTFMWSFFAVFGLALSAMGIYGVMSYAVNERTREIGIGIALGAEPAQVLRSVLRQGTRLALGGVGIGLVAAAGLTRYLSSMLTEVEATDPVVFASVSVLLVLVALSACYVPAHRATKVDPIEALRAE